MEDIIHHNPFKVIAPTITGSLALASLASTADRVQRHLGAAQTQLPHLLVHRHWLASLGRFTGGFQVNPWT